MTASGRPRIVIVGAGPAGLSAAFHLTDPRLQPDWRERYTVHVYQMGWRAGGKGATGRNEELHERIEEHGIHLFGNFYYNSTRMLETVCNELDWDEHDSCRTIEDLFLPSNASSGTDYFDHRWWQTLTPMLGSEGAPWRGQVRLDERDVVGHLLEHLVHILERAIRAERPTGLRADLERLPLDAATGWLRALRRRVRRAIAEERRHPAPPNPDHLAVVDDLGSKVRTLGHVQRLLPHNALLRAVYIECDLLVTVLRGLIVDRVSLEGLDSIDGCNYDEWLERHGASTVTLSSGWPQSIPNTALSYLNGDTTRLPTMSAAAFVNFFTRWIMGAGPGAFFFRQGTGDTIIKPLYRLLVQRGVVFHFFHKLREVETAGDGADRRVSRLVFDRQATVRGDGRYEPLRRLDGDGEEVWPNRPLYAQLVEGDELRASDELPGGGYDLESWWTAWRSPGTETLTAGADFAHVVLATPIATLPHTCGALIERSTAWATMVRDIRSTATQALQLWTDRTTADLGWAGPLRGTDRYLGGIFGQDLTSYCDFSDLVAEERWPPPATPRGLVYLIGALSDPEEIPGFDDHDYPRRQRARVKWMSVQFLRAIDGLLPKAAVNPVDPRSFDFAMLVPDDGSTGVNRFDQQYWRANVDPNERYTLTVAGSVAARPEAWGSGYSNLVLAGDWIYTGWNVGSFEAAVMSGKLASLALTGAPALDDVWGYDFLQLRRPPPPPPPYA